MIDTERIAQLERASSAALSVWDADYRDHQDVRNAYEVVMAAKVAPRLLDLGFEQAYPSIVAVALEFADQAATDQQILTGIMRALRGKSNPAPIMAEIKKQRS